MHKETPQICFSSHFFIIYYAWGAKRSSKTYTCSCNSLKFQSWNIPLLSAHNERLCSGFKETILYSFWKFMGNFNSNSSLFFFLISIFGCFAYWNCHQSSEEPERLAYREAIKARSRCFKNYTNLNKLRITFDIFRSLYYIFFLWGSFMGGGGGSLHYKILNFIKFWGQFESGQTKL